jgi:undecaprenyl-diphosphatase
MLACAAVVGMGAVGLVALRNGIAAGKTRQADERWVLYLGLGERSAADVSWFAEPRTVALETVALALLPRWRLRERWSIASAPLLAGLAGACLKLWLPRERPNKTRFAPTGDESFPSDHTALAAALVLSVAGAARAHGAGPWVYAVGAAAAALIGVERVRAAAHWPSDVLAGAVLGTMAAAAVHPMSGGAL